MVGRQKGRTMIVRFKSATRNIARDLRLGLAARDIGQGVPSCNRVAPATWEPSEELVAQMREMGYQGRDAEIAAICQITRWAMLAAKTSRIAWDVFDSGGQRVYHVG